MSQSDLTESEQPSVVIHNVNQDNRKWYKKLFDQITKEPSTQMGATVSGLRKTKWWLVALIEMFGTFLLVLLITAPASTMDTSNRSNIFASMFDYKIFVAAWVSTGIFILIILFGLVSANFNPAVTLIEIFDGHDSIREGGAKIFAQFIGAISASFVVYAIANSNGMAVDGEFTLGASTPQLFMPTELSDLFGWDSHKLDMDMSWWWIIILVFEGVGTFLLLYFVIGKRNKKRRKTLLMKAAYISVGLFFVIWVNDTFMAATLNPARAMAPAMVSNWMGGNQEVLGDSFINLSAQIFAVMAYGAFVQQRDYARIRF